jgi:hypothetical protein
MDPRAAVSIKHNLTRWSCACMKCYMMNSEWSWN